MANRPSLDDYVDVAERIVAFDEKYPEGSLQTIDWTVADVAGKPFIVYRAAAYRSPDDPRPGHGIAWEPFPGTTPYTKNSELMNAETAAWGRAIVALGLTANRKLASRQEVRARQEEQEADPKPSSRKSARPRPTTPPPASDGHSEAQDVAETPSVLNPQLLEIAKLARAAELSVKDWKALAKEAGAEGKKSHELTQDQADWVILKLREKGK